MQTRVTGVAQDMVTLSSGVNFVFVDMETCPLPIYRQRLKRLSVLLQHMRGLVFEHERYHIGGGAVVDLQRECIVVIAATDDF